AGRDGGLEIALRDGAVALGTDRRCAADDPGGGAMRDFNAPDRDVTRAIRSWLHEDRHEDASRIAAAVLDRVESTPRRRVSWWPARRFLDMNTFAKVFVAAAAVVAVAFVGINLLPR